MTRQQNRLLVNFFFASTVIMTVLSTVFTRNGELETANLFTIICVGSAVAGLIVQLIHWIAPKFGSKPTGEELEQRIKG